MRPAIEKVDIAGNFGNHTYTNTQNVQAEVENHGSYQQQRGEQKASLIPKGVEKCKGEDGEKRLDPATGLFDEESLTVDLERVHVDHMEDIEHVQRTAGDYDGYSLQAES